MRIFVTDDLTIIVKNVKARERFEDMKVLVKESGITIPERYLDTSSIVEDLWNLAFYIREIPY